MEFAALDRSVRTARRGRNLAVVLLVTMIGANALLGLRLLNQSNQVVLIPTQVSDGMVARGAVDKRYVEALALDAVYAMYNATPETLDYGRQVLDRLSSLRERSAILDQYDRIATDMRERKISTVFFPEKLEHNYATYEIVVDGFLKTYVETTFVTSERRRILLRFVPQAGSVRLAAITRLEIG
jgi:conjugal transfer pilus assembly protein TraE